MNPPPRLPFLALIATAILLTTSVASARWYDPHAGRFIGRSAFPVEVEPAYEFAGNAPTIGYDADGRTPLARVIEWLTRNGAKHLDDLAKNICKCKKFPKPGKHKGFIKQLCYKTDKQLEKDIRSRLRLIEEHLKKLDESPGSIHENHWKKEIKNWMSELACIELEMAKRGIAGGGSAVGICCLNDCCAEGNGKGGGCGTSGCPAPGPGPDPDRDALGWLVDFIFGCETAEAPGD